MTRNVRVVILAGTGKGFCAGHDLKEIKALKELPKIEALFGQCSRMMQTIPLLPQPVIARVQGVAAAAGCQLVAQCDLAVAVEPRSSSPAASPGASSAPPRASRSAATCSASTPWRCCSPASRSTPQRALEWGLVNRVVPQSSWMTRSA